ncbi:MAG: hypothetical protein DIU54_011120 [Acidobacteriota bacterium]|jgi:hypothetical protein|nr:MAG: hypothetical protein DIU54_07790 [Acidobacteriota bacterium]
MRPVLSRRLTSLGLSAALLALGGCTAEQPGQASSYVMIQSLEGASGAKPDEFSGTLASDVVTLVKAQIDGQEARVPTVYEDPGRAVFRLAMKDPGFEPAPNNFITFTRYRVNFVRTDGRNTPGVDVPYPFDGAVTVTVTDQPTTATFTLVRIQSKLENPLRLLAGGGGSLAISTLAEVTFFGKDQTGRDVTATGRITVNFADWGDPE